MFLRPFSSAIREYELVGAEAGILDGGVKLGREGIARYAVSILEV